jgi:hypothetical protein
MNSPGFDTAREDLAASMTPSPELPPTWEGAKARLGRARKLVAIGGLLAGLIAFGVGEAVYNVIPAQRVLQKIKMSNIELMRPTQETENVAAVKNAALTFGLLGVCLGGFLGIAGGLARRSTSAAATAGFLGAVLASALGVGVSLALLPYCLKAQLDHTDNDLIIALLMHSLIWGSVGAIAGLAFAIGLGERRLVLHAVTASLAGAVLGTIAYELIGAALFSSAETVNPISMTWPTRLMARLLVTVGTAVVLALILAKPRDAAPVSQAEASAPLLKP